MPQYNRIIRDAVILSKIRRNSFPVLESQIKLIAYRDIALKKRKNDCFKVGFNAFHEIIVDVGFSVNGSTVSTISSHAFQAGIPLNSLSVSINDPFCNINPNIGVFLGKNIFQFQVLRKLLIVNPYLFRRKGNSTFIIYLMAQIFLRLKKKGQSFYP